VARPERQRRALSLLPNEALRGACGGTPPRLRQLHDKEHPNADRDPEGHHADVHRSKDPLVRVAQNGFHQHVDKHHGPRREEAKARHLVGNAPAVEPGVVAQQDVDAAAQAVEARRGCPEQEEDERPQVRGPDAVVDKGAVVVHLDDAAPTDAAVVRLRGLHVLAVEAVRVVREGAPGYLLAGLGVGRFCGAAAAAATIDGGPAGRHLPMPCDVLRAARGLEHRQVVVEVDIEGENGGEGGVQPWRWQPRDDKPDAKTDHAGDKADHNDNRAPLQAPLEEDAGSCLPKTLEKGVCFAATAACFSITVVTRSF